MADIKHTWIFFGPQSAQWSEVWYLTSAEARSSLEIIGDPFVNARLAFLNSQCTLRMVRASNTNGMRDTDQYILNRQGLSAGTAAIPSTPDVSGVTAIWDVQGQIGGKRKVFFRGLSDSDVVRSPTNGIDQPSASLKTQVEAFLSKARTSGYALRYRQAPNIPNMGYRLASGVDGAFAQGRSEIGVDNTVGLAVGDLVTLSNFDPKSLPGLNSTFKILSLAPLKITIGYATPNFTNFVGSTGRVRKLAYNPLDIISPAECEFDRFGTRQTKASFFGSRGAKFAQRRRRLG